MFVWAWNVGILAECTHVGWMSVWCEFFNEPSGTTTFVVCYTVDRLVQQSIMTVRTTIVVYTHSWIRCIIQKTRMMTTTVATDDDILLRRRRQSTATTMNNGWRAMTMTNVQVHIIIYISSSKHLKKREFSCSLSALSLTSWLLYEIGPRLMIGSAGCLVIPILLRWHLVPGTWYEYQVWKYQVVLLLGIRS